VSDPVTVNGRQIAAGEYTVKWEGNGPSVELNILRGKNVVATVPARVIDLDHVPNRDSAVTIVNSDGHKSLNEIRFSGKKYALAVGAETAKAESGDTTK
jgi:ribosomal protein L2